MRAQEQHGRLAVVGQALDLGQGVQALPGEAFGEQRQEVGDGGPAGELVVGGVQEPLDGLGVERAVEVAAEAGGGGLERDLLVEGDVAAVVGLASSSAFSVSGCVRTRVEAGSEIADPPGQFVVGAVERGRRADADRIGHRPVQVGPVAEFFVGEVAHGDDQVAAGLDVVDRSGAAAGAAAAGGARRRRSRRGRSARAGWVPADAAGTGLAWRHSAAASCERAEFAVHTNTTRLAARSGGGVSSSRISGTSRR